MRLRKSEGQENGIIQIFFAVVFLVQDRNVAKHP